MCSSAAAASICSATFSLPLLFHLWFSPFQTALPYPSLAATEAPSDFPTKLNPSSVMCVRTTSSPTTWSARAPFCAPMDLPFTPRHPSSSSALPAPSRFSLDPSLHTRICGSWTFLRRSAEFGLLPFYGPSSQVSLGSAVTLVSFKLHMFLSLVSRSLIPRFFLPLLLLLLIALVATFSGR